MRGAGDHRGGGRVQEADFSADMLQSQCSMGFIGSGGFVHGNGVTNSFTAFTGDVSPKQMHDSVKPSDLMLSMINTNN